MCRFFKSTIDNKGFSAIDNFLTALRELLIVINNWFDLKLLKFAINIIDALLNTETKDDYNFLYNFNDFSK
jgi:hypothetical protein